MTRSALLLPFTASSVHVVDHRIPGPFTVKLCFIVGGAHLRLTRGHHHRTTQHEKHQYQG